MLALLLFTLSINNNQYDLYIQKEVNRTELNKEITSGVKIYAYADDVAVYLSQPGYMPHPKALLIKTGVTQERLALAWFHSPEQAEQLSPPENVELLYRGKTFWLISANSVLWDDLRSMGAEVVPVNKEALVAARASSIPTEPQGLQVIRTAVSKISPARLMFFDQTMTNFVSRFTYDSRLLEAQQWSTDNYAAWQIPASDFYYNSLGSLLHFYGIKLDVELASYFGFIYKKVAGTWQTYHANMMILDTKYSPDGATLYLVGRGGLVGWNTTPNDFSTFAIHDTGCGKDLYGIFVEGNRIWAVGKNGTLVYSSDHGETWVQIPTGIAVETLEEVGRFHVGTGAQFRFYIVGGNRTVLRSDDGLTWTRLDNVPVGAYWLRDIKGFENTNTNTGDLLVVGANNFIMTSQDGGDNWVTQTSPAGYWMHCGFAAGRCWAVGTNGSVANSDDFGITWTSHNILTDSLLENTWLTVDNNTAFICGQYNAFYRTQDGGLTWQHLPNPNSNYQSKDIIAELTGSTKPDEIVIVCAHQDSTSDNPYLAAPGADDNGTGSAVVMAVAEQMQRMRYERTVRFILFSGEEQGLLGSHAYADAALAAGENIVGVLNADMVGYKDDNTDDLDIRIASVGAELQSFTKECADKYVPGLVIFTTSGGTGGSDHQSFSDNGYQAITAIEHQTLSWYPYYHTQQDTPDKLDQGLMAKTAQMYLATAMELAVPIAGRYNTNTTTPYVFPNPLHMDRGQKILTFANLEPGCRIKVFDLNGNLVSEHISTETQHEWIPNLSAGIYLYQVEQSGRKFVNKLAIIK